EGVAGQIQVSPNPVQDVLSFTLPSSISSVKVMNALGQVMIEKNNVSETLKIDFSALATGTYMVVLLDKNSGAIVRKVQKY
ncbi:MAG: T9SS type A sorting domain-containing protein, partial [Bacteroidota bacterium]